MATSDVELQGYAKTYIIPFVVFVVVIKLSRRQQSKLYAKVYAYIVNQIGYRHNKLIKTRKEKLFLGLHEQATQSERRISILEIGAGGGANFKYYPKNANVTCLDPNPEFAKYLEKNVAECPWVNLVESVWGSAEDMSAFPSGSVDAVVCTLVLCSINNQDSVLKEIHRILRPVSICHNFVKIHQLLYNVSCVELILTGYAAFLRPPLIVDLNFNRAVSLKLNAWDMTLD